MRHNPISRLALAGAAATLGLLSMSGTTSHASDEYTVAKVDGVWKAYASYTDQGNQLCVRAYNSVRGADAIAYLRLGGGRSLSVEDEGGDRERTCRRLDVPENVWMQLEVFHHSSLGDGTSTTGWVSQGET